MDGCDIFAITGIDGDNRAGVNLLEPFLDIVHFLSYDRSISFVENANAMRDKIITSHSTDVVLIGWSIGGAMALCLAELEYCKKCISINSFFNRRQYLLSRNIFIDDDDDFCADRLNLHDKDIMIIAGGSDERIPYTNSIQIYDCLKQKNNVTLSVFSNLRHSVASFSETAKKTISMFIHDSKETL